MSKKILLGFIAGAAAGTLIGILLAPDKGSNTRRKLKKTMGRYIEQTRDSLELFTDTEMDTDEIFDWEQAERPYTAYVL